MNINIRCQAKLNLCLKVYDERPDGYHNIISLMQSIELADTLIVETTDDGGFQLECEIENVPHDESNLIWVAAVKLAEHLGREPGGLRVKIEKGIPVGGGLAGGSSNAAGVLKALNLLWDADLNGAELLEVALQVGSDVPFCFIGGTILCRGRGENMEIMPDGIAALTPDPGAFLIVIPKIEVNTKKAYGLLDEFRLKEVKKWESDDAEYRELFGLWCQGISARSFSTLFVNDFEEAVMSEYPELNDIRSNLRNYSGNASMSGSGSCMFAHFTRTSDAYVALGIYKPVHGENVIVARAVNQGTTLGAHSFPD